jgi:uncharacterized metal-binding protein
LVLIYREVTTEDGEKRAKELDIIFVECSAKDGSNVQQVFKNIGQFLPGNEPSQLMSTTGCKQGSDFVHSNKVLFFLLFD